MRLKDQMKGIIPKPLLYLVPNRFEVIGDLAVISIPSELDGFKYDIAGMIVSGRKNIATVLNKVAVLHGDERVGRFEILLGSDTKTTHREYGYTFKLDIGNVFFNPRLSFERNRVASLVEQSEQVLVPFCGVGPFVVPVAARGAGVIAIEKNVMACRYLAENIRQNRVGGTVSIILADAASIINLINGRFDRIIVPAPYGADHYLRMLSPLVKKGGMIHFYAFKKQHQIPDILEEYEHQGFEVVFHRRCGNVAPAVSRWVFDLKKQ